MNEQKGDKLTGDPRVDFKWFSRRYETSEAHKIACDRRQKRQDDKLQLTEVNRVARSVRTPQQQLEVLDKRLGAGIGAAKERARLTKEIALRAASVEAIVDGKAMARWVESKPA